MSIPTLVTFIVYFVLLLGIGFYFYRKSVSIEDYLLGGRGMGAWVTALSAQASDMSGWLLMALPGAIYAYGMGKVWIPIGLFLGTVLNWKLVAGRLRVYTQKTDTITLPCFFEQRFGDPTGLLRVVSAIIILIFFTIYASSGLMATGKLFESTFGIQYRTAVIVGGGIIIAYTFLGGFLALIIVPTAAYLKVGGMETVSEAMKLKQISTSLLPAKGIAGPIAIISAMAWGLGYFGQPHILTRFMSVKSVRKLPESMTIAIIWVFLSLTGAVIVGFVGIGMFENLAVEEGEHEKVFIYMIGEVMHPWLAGIMLAAILSAIMSTIDSQLLVSSSALTEDFYQKAIKRNATEKEIILVGRICVIIISVIALILALRPSDTILGIVAYAWGGFGAAFGPLVLFGLFSRKTGWQSALAGMVMGTVVLVVWKQVGLGEYMYEIVPGFIANCLTIFVVNIAIGQKDEKILRQYRDVVRVVHGKE
jgi:sodium/proline symporter